MLLFLRNDLAQDRLALLILGFRQHFIVEQQAVLFRGDGVHQDIAHGLQLLIHQGRQHAAREDDLRSDGGQEGVCFQIIGFILHFFDFFAHFLKADGMTQFLLTQQLQQLFRRTVLGDARCHAVKTLALALDLRSDLQRLTIRKLMHDHVVSLQYIDRFIYYHGTHF